MSGIFSTTCDNCRFSFCEIDEQPCCDCQNSEVIGSGKYNKKPFLWEPKEEAKADNVNHPSHYNQGKFECIDVMVETFGIEAAKHFCLLNAFKYIWRTGEKNGAEDVEKAIWYLKKFLELESEQHGNLSEQN